MDIKRDNSSYNMLKWGIWAYFLLLIFEGALRKWFLPFLSGPLAIVRDPLALWILMVALKRGYLKLNMYVVSTFFVGIIALGTTFLLGHGNLGVSIYGARIILLQFPLIFVIGQVLDLKDVLAMGKVLVYLAIPMTVLMALQFYSPQSAWVNRGIGGDLEGAGFSGALGFYRPPGTFSFISGLTQYYSLAACFIIYFWFKQHLINRVVLILATLGFVMAIPFSISRTLLYQTVITIFFMIFAASQKAENIPKIIFGSIGFVVILLLLSSTSLLETPLEAFTARFEGATKYEGGVGGTIVDRYIGGMITSIFGSSDIPFFGYGIGIGTNAGGKILTGEITTLFYAEDEWSRIIGESGLLLGFAFILIRVVLSIDLTIKAYFKLKSGDQLPWLLISVCIILIANGQWGQITALGFTIFTTGILVATLKKSDKLS
ncbi:hypothetical protein [Maribacter sp. Asnod1-A12]|uniref:hypothetical protein n=1 Tax=Maribacter sp. Asnod1-A12 TaxID=3160576 RepID=UPI003866CE45